MCGRIVSLSLFASIFHHFESQKCDMLIDVLRCLIIEVLHCWRLWCLSCHRRRQQQRRRRKLALNILLTYDILVVPLLVAFRTSSTTTVTLFLLRCVRFVHRRTSRMTAIAFFAAHRIEDEEKEEKHAQHTKYVCIGSYYVYVYVFSMTIFILVLLLWYYVGSSNSNVATRVTSQMFWYFDVLMCTCVLYIYGATCNAEPNCVAIVRCHTVSI